MNAAMVPHKGDMELNEVFGKSIFLHLRAEFQNIIISNEDTLWPLKETFSNTNMCTSRWKYSRDIQVVGVSKLNFKTNTFSTCPLT